ncbi:MAG: M56 family metallopeptidase [Planctomycetota bacterium]
MSPISNQWLLFLLDISIKSLLLAIVAGLVMKLLRIRDSNLRHRIWSGVLAGMLALPLLSYALPSIPINLPQVNPLIAEDDSAGPELPRVAVAPPAGPVTNPLESSSVPADVVVSQSADVSHLSASEASDVLHSVPTAPAWTVSDWLRVGSAVLFIAWICVAALFAIRLVVGLVSATRLLGRADVVVDELCELMDLPPSTTATIRETAEVCVPVTVGWIRPTVLLPPDWREWTHEKLSAIIAHELTHVARRDFVVALAAELNRCLYWFHPVAWWLRTQLSDLAEEACDDAAIYQTGDRTSYARHLLEVAAAIGQSSGRVVEPGLAMARESNVESRIATILDFKRPLSERVSWKAALMIGVVALPMIAATAAVQPVNQADAGGNATLNAKAKETEGGKDDEAGKMYRVQGQVTDEAGSPIAHALVSVWRVHRPHWYAADTTSLKVADLKVGADGRFDQSFPAHQLPDSDQRQGGKWSVIVAKAKGHAVRSKIGHVTTYEKDGERVRTVDFRKEPMTLKLPKALPIRGTLLSLEGLPVPNAKVEVYKVATSKADRLEKWLEKAARKPKKTDSRLVMMGGPPPRDSFFPGGDINLPLGVISKVVSNSKGQFEIDDLIGKDDVAVLRVTDANIAYKLVHVLGWEMKTVYGPGMTIVDQNVPFLGKTFSVVAEPSVPVYGIVRDVDTKEPLANTWVAVGGTYGTTMSQSGFIRTRTDKEGRYRIEGLPIIPQGLKSYQKNRLEIRPEKLPYVETDVVVPRGNGKDPTEFNIELRRAIVAKGRLTNRQTGKPIALARMYYAPYSKNDHCAKFARYADGTTMMLGNDTRYHTDEDGNFEIPVIPGRGVVAAQVTQGGFVAGYGAKSIEAFEDEKDSYTVLSDHIIPSSFHSLAEIDVAEDAESHELTMEVDEGVEVTVKFVDQDGKPVSGAEGGGLTSNRQWKKLKDKSHVSIPGMAIGEVRSVQAFHYDRKLARMVRIVPEEGKSEFTVQLLPYGKLTGRITDTEGRPVAKAVVQASHHNDPIFLSSLRQVVTDDEGKFTYELPVGIEYDLQIRIEDQIRTYKKVDMSEKPMRIDLGDLVYDEFGKRWSELEPKEKAKVTDIATASSIRKN